jgi:hypothetical protein
MSPRELREWLIGECAEISQIEVPEGYVLSPEDEMRHGVVVAALTMAINGIACFDGRLVDQDALERDREGDDRRGARRKQGAEGAIDVGSPGTSTAPSEEPRGSEGGQFEVTPSSVTLSDPVTPSAKCETCGTMFARKRSTARYCSTNCRVAAHRKRYDA